MASSTTTPSLERERELCTLLSCLFLDTEHTPDDIDAIGSSLFGLQVSIATAEHVLRYDLFPILGGNLLSVTGEWAFFDEDWLWAQVQTRRASFVGVKLIRNVGDSIAWRIVGRYMVWPNWMKVKERYIARM
ncbi:hypothetical protein BOTBODRAFT_180046 [Botryobasidium botryosum FD-172 SS1]|uniref:DUF7079 domain-containing protein n=1 Tax=Botryobasidium botryosum (strain FD-172 SS1) TaxID=930990 RepID=A0A067M9M1_BOTB1|nr:hypothetical protein BOTBODRAFT_180046 [Botryobasidium botryosum FD-172 SS1]